MTYLHAPAPQRPTTRPLGANLGSILRPKIRRGMRRLAPTIFASMVRNYLSLKLTLTLLQKQDISCHQFHASPINGKCLLLQH